MFRLQLAVSVLVLSLFSTVLYTSCIKDKCGSVVCANKGICVEGVCSCPVLYEGSSCEIDWVDKFSGNWKVDETFLRDTSRTRYKYDMQIAGGADSFIIAGLGDTLGNIICKRTSRLGFSFKEAQKLPDSIVTINDGRGTLSENGSEVIGLYSFRYKDTTITSSFRWTR